MRDLSTLLNPNSIAVVGASEKAGSFGGQVLKNLIDFAYPGQLSAVHPKATSVFGRPCSASLSKLDEVPECIALAVANHQLIALLEEAASLGVRSAVVFGDPTVGAGRAPELQNQIAELCEQHAINVCGPNAMGLYALARRMVISGYPVDPALPIGRVALLTHSGTVFDALSQNNRDVGFNYVIAGGNEASVTVSDYLAFVLDDPSTRAVALYLETVRDPRAFEHALARAEAARIPLIALKVGLSEIGKAMTQAHTGALAGGGETYAALFSKYGVQQVDTLDEMMDCIELFGRIDAAPARRLSVLMESGGERSLVADLSQSLDVEFATLEPSSEQALRECLDEGVIPNNPLDAFGTGHDVARVYRQCLNILGDDPNTDIVVLAVDLVRDSYLSPAYVEAALNALASLRKPLIVLVNLTAGANVELMAKLREHGVPVLMGTATGLRALHHFSRFAAHRPIAAETIGRPDEKTIQRWVRTLGESDAALDELTSKQLLADYGISTSTEAIASTLEQAQRIAETIGYPVVMKTAETGIVHKSDVGGIALNLRDAAELTHAYHRLRDRLGPRVLVQQMAKPGVELILGMHRDPQFGAVVLCGLGGIFVEVIRDTVNFLPPTNRASVKDMLGRLQGYPLLSGARGQTSIDTDKLCEQVVRFTTLIADLSDYLEAIDINPLIANAEGTCVVDALVIPNLSPPA